MFSVWAFYSPMLSLDICNLNLLILIFLLRYKILKFSTNGSRTPSLIWQFHHSVHSAYHTLPKRWSCLSLGFLGLFFFFNPFWSLEISLHFSAFFRLIVKIFLCSVTPAYNTISGNPYRKKRNCMSQLTDKLQSLSPQFIQKESRRQW